MVVLFSDAVLTSLHMERVGKIFCDSQSDYEDGARKHTF